MADLSKIQLPTTPKIIKSTSTTPGNVSSLIDPNVLNTINKAKNINTFGDQLSAKDNITMIRSSNGSTLDNLLKEKERLTQEEIDLDIQYQNPTNSTPTGEEPLPTKTRYRVDYFDTDLKRRTSKYFIDAKSATPFLNIIGDIESPFFSLGGYSAYYELGNYYDVAPKLSKIERKILTVPNTNVTVLPDLNASISSNIPTEQPSTNIDEQTRKEIIEGTWSKDPKKRTNPPPLIPGRIKTTDCGDKTNREAYPAKKYPEYVKVSHTVSKEEILNYLKSKIGQYPINVIRSTYASFGIESGYGKYAINNNLNGMQTDGGEWPEQEKYIIGTTNFRESTPDPNNPKIGGKCRAFAVYRSWQDCCDHVLYIMNTRIEGSNSRRIIVPLPSNPDPAGFWSRGYGKNWIANGGKADVRVYWKDAVRKIKEK